MSQKNGTWRNVTPALMKEFELQKNIHSAARDKIWGELLARYQQYIPSAVRAGSLPFTHCHHSFHTVTTYPPIHNHSFESMLDVWEKIVIDTRVNSERVMEEKIAEIKADLKEAEEKRKRDFDEKEARKKAKHDSRTKSLSKFFDQVFSFPLFPFPLAGLFPIFQSEICMCFVSRARLRSYWCG